MRFGRLLLLNLSLLFSTTLAAQPAQRVISLAPHATELAFAAGLGSKLIAVSEYSDYPPSAKSIERVANYQSIKVERIVTLKPDLVIVWPAGNPPRELEKLRQLGLNLYYSDIRQLDDIATNIEQLAQYADDPKPGQQAAQRFRQQLQSLRAEYAHAKPVRYFYQLSEKPLITVAQNSWPSEVFRVCGGENVFAHSPAAYPQVGIEQVLLAQPEVIFTTEQAPANGAIWQRWQNQIPALQQGYVWVLNSDWLTRPTLRSLNAIQQVCNYLDQVRKP